MSNPIYRPPAPREEAQSRLISLLSVCEHELASLEALGDDNLASVIDHMRAFHEELLVALIRIPEPASSHA
jgi:hypothetical protein